MLNSSHLTLSVTYDDIAECDENIPAEYLPEDCEV
jgi:hypothetical protein